MKRLVAFLVLSACMLCVCAPGAGAQTHSLADIVISPSHPTPASDITIRLSGIWSDSCVPGSPVDSINANCILISTSNPGEVCLTVMTDWSLKVPIGKLKSGDYTVLVEHANPYGRRELGRATFTVHETSYTFTDVVRTLRIAGGLSGAGSMPADSSQSSAATLLDAVTILRQLMGLDAGS